MTDLTLTPLPPLADIDRVYDGITLKQITDKALVSVATPLGGEKKLATAIYKSWGTETPKTGHSTSADKNDMRLLGLQSDQVFLFFDYSGNDPVNVIKNQIGDVGYYSDQSDSWTIITLEGANVRRALERMCSLDLHADAFSIGAVTRTQMEHLGVIIYRSAKNTFTLFSARSSAQSFYHSIVTSIENVL